MTAVEHPATIESLLPHRAWVRSVARRMVRDENEVDDLEQDAWEAALRSPPRRAGARAWLARVVRNRALDRRKSAAVRRAEPLLDPVPGARSTADVVAQADAHRRLVEAVMALDEPYRTAILLRFFEDLPPRDVAARLDVPVETVRTRTRRALERLRADLGDDPRAGWMAVVLPLVRLEPGEATTGLAAAGTLGGIAVTLTSKTTIAAALLALAIGFSAGWGVKGTTPTEDDPETVADVDAASSETAPGPSAEEFAALTKRLERTQAELTGQKQRAVTAERRVEELTARTAEVERAATESETTADAPMPFPAHEDTLTRVAWPEVGEAIHGMTPILVELLTSMKEGKEMAPKRIGELQMHNAPLIQAVVNVMEDLPGIGPSGAFLHPAFVARAMQATLAAADHPLTEKQAEQIRGMAQAELDAAAERTRFYGPRTLQLRKLYDEASGRGRFLEAAFLVLTSEQREILRPAEVRGYCQADLFCEGLQWALLVQPFTHRGRENFGRRVGSHLERELEISDATGERLEPIAEQWIAGVPDELFTVPATGLEMHAFAEFAHVKRAVSHFLVLAERMLAEGDLTEDEATKLIALEKSPVPYLKTGD